MTDIETIKFIDTVLRTLHLDPNKVTEVSIEINDTKTRILVHDIKGNTFRYIFSKPLFVIKSLIDDLLVRQQEQRNTKAGVQ
jgi:tRNA1(Val) A37 N6-methylase TrmN6